MAMGSVPVCMKKRGENGLLLAEPVIEVLVELLPELVPEPVAEPVASKLAVQRQACLPMSESCSRPASDC